MALEIKQSLKLSQQLVITPQLQQAIKLLQLSRTELSELIQSELVENPVLEENEGATSPEADGEYKNASEEKAGRVPENGHDHTSEELIQKDGTLKEPANFDWENYMETFNSPWPSSSQPPSTELPTYENTLTEQESLHDHLLWQIHLSNFESDDIAVAHEIIGNINDDGYLQGSCSDIATTCNVASEKVEAVLKKIQQLDPLGVGARDLAECLSIQAMQLGVSDTLLRDMVSHYSHDLETHNYPAIAKKLRFDTEEVREMAAFIQTLEPKPGRPFSPGRTEYITPDVYVHKIGDEYIVSLNEDGLPKLQISNFYRRALMGGSEATSETKEYVQEKLKSAMWFIKSIHQRQQTLYKVTKSIAKFQYDFLEKGFDHLRPMVLKDVAEDIGMHESTVSRVTTNKYVHTHRGLFELKFFFNSSVSQLDGDGIAAESVKMHIEKMISNEDNQHPLSDQEIVILLKEHNISIARRTVAKYREMLAIPPSSKRKRFE